MYPKMNWESKLQLKAKFHKNNIICFVGGAVSDISWRTLRSAEENPWWSLAMSEAALYQERVILLKHLRVEVLIV